MQKTLNDDEFGWDIIENEIANNKLPRINWKPILGMSLTRAVALLRAEGLTSKDTYNEICKTHDLSNEEKRRLKIGICARYGEIGTSESAKKEVTTHGNK